MTRRLILMRHAKSSWDNLTAPDKDRVLNERGRASADLLGQWMKAQGHEPDQVLVSSAARTMETCDRVLKASGVAPDVTAFDTLYLAGEMRILNQLQKATGRVVLLIAHNPGIGEFAARFASNPPNDADFMRYPTGATTVFDLQAADWSEAKFGENAMVDFALPRALVAAQSR